MNWMNEIGGILQRYSQGQEPSSVDTDFDQFARSAPREELAYGLGESFRSDKTPPFPQMLAQLFTNSNSTQRASILNMLLAAAGPMILSKVIPSLQNAVQQSQITPEQAAEVQPEAIQEAAAAAEHKDPSVIDRISEFYAEQPHLVKTLGAAALTIALAQLGRKHKLL